MTPEQKKNVEDWIAALESGKYAKGCYSLNFDNRLCCLGVLCEIQNVPKNQGLNVFVGENLYTFEDKFHYTDEEELDENTSYVVVPETWFNRITGLNNDDMLKLMELNDRYDTFEPVIEEIKERLNRIMGVDMVVPRAL